MVGMFVPAYGDPQALAVWGMHYNGYAVLDERGLCPSGWHSASDEDFIVLEAHLGLEENLYEFTCRGESINLGGMFKEEGTIEAGTGYWNYPNSGSNNASGLAMRANGWRSPTGVFETGGGEYGLDGNFWTSTFVPEPSFQPDPDGGLIRRRCDHDDFGVQRDSYGVHCGFAVRCLKSAE